jgi:hypothetical protein
VISGTQISQILEYLAVSPLSAGKLIPRVIKSLYSALSEHILCNYMTKEIWLKQCYSIQNGSFQGVRDMEAVPLSKFTAMCMIHKEAMDQINNENDPIQ